MSFAHRIFEVSTQQQTQHPLRALVVCGYYLFPCGMHRIRIDLSFRPQPLNNTEQGWVVERPSSKQKVGSSIPVLPICMPKCPWEGCWTSSYSFTGNKIVITSSLWWLEILLFGKASDVRWYWWWFGFNLNNFRKQILTFGHFRHDL